MTAIAVKTARLGLLEVKLLFRRKITAVSAAVMPLALCGLTWFGERDVSSARWGEMMGSRFALLMVLSVFMTSMTVYTARRQSLVLKRLRTTELTDAGVIAAITAPVVVMGLVQVLIYFTFCVAIGAPLPTHPWLVLIGVVLGVLLTVGAGMATAALSKSVEATHVTSFPVLTLAMAGLLTYSAPQVAVAVTGVAMPVMGPADLVGKGWAGFDTGVTLAQLPGPLLGLASTLLWTVIFGAVIARWFRWEPRS